ncbi:hypothetical protein PsorP6_017164 [Peronosclerospora sorghi]|uniref:Uncharacterized protein n=1 Tax=Peronosclerospora sorghi TaxID=230839 RepID=A0ACC0WDG8_9STRA|nr:hypothetical protein PsorP6_017164 [Peronosclerospora sorghi]
MIAARVRFVVRKVIDRFVVRVDPDIFQHGVRPNSIENVGLMLFNQVNRLGVPSTLKSKDTFVVAAVFVVTNELALRLGRQRRFARARKSKENGSVPPALPILADACMVITPLRGK